MPLEDYDDDGEDYDDDGDDNGDDVDDNDDRLRPLKVEIHRSTVSTEVHH